MMNSDKVDVAWNASTYSCLLVGATGLVGLALLRQLLADPACYKITVLARRPFDRPVADSNNRSKLHVIVADFDRLQEALDDVQADVVFCALGTTIKAAGSQEAFRQVDYEYPLSLAKWAEHTGVRHYMVITAMGASVSSPFFYSRVKGELEEQLSLIQIESITFFRPSLLLGYRSSKRFAETVGAMFSKAVQWIMIGPLRQYRPIAGEDVARAMRTAAKQAIAEPAKYRNDGRQPTVHAYSSDSIAALAAHTTG